MSNLLGEAMQLSSRPTSLVRRPSMQPDGGPRVPAGTVVERLPLDLGLKKDCVVTSQTALKWCSSACPAAQAKAIAADGSGAAEQLHRALAHWRYPGQKLPGSLVKLLTQPNLQPAEAAHANGLRNDWSAAFHSLYFALREGRCPYFYLRRDARTASLFPYPSRHSPPATLTATLPATLPATPRPPHRPRPHPRPRPALALRRCDAFTLLWRNAAAPHGHGSVGGGGKASDSDGEAGEAGGPCAADGRACYAVLAPSMKGLRSELKAHGVPFEMPSAGAVLAAEP